MRNSHKISVTLKLRTKGGQFQTAMASAFRIQKTSLGIRENTSLAIFSRVALFIHALFYYLKNSIIQVRKYGKILVYITVHILSNFDIPDRFI